MKLINSANSPAIISPREFEFTQYANTYAFGCVCLQGDQLTLGLKTPGGFISDAARGAGGDIRAWHRTDPADRAR
jgi:hypothetical protein